jgi:hypothetical protein
MGRWRLCNFGRFSKTSVSGVRRRIPIAPVETAPSGGARHHSDALRSTSAQGQSEKNSVRVYVFRFALKLGHCSTQPALRICANKRLMHCSKVREISTSYAARSTRLSISLRSVPKSIGLVRSPSAPCSSARRLVSASP